MTEPLPTEPLLDLNRLALWAQENPLTDPAFAALVVDAVSTLLREVGSKTWTMATLPKRAADIAYFVARNYYLNPDLTRQESLGPIQTTLDNKVLIGVDFTEDQRAEIRALATDAPGEVDGLWTLGWSRGPLETGQRNLAGNTVLFDTRGGWPIEYLTEEQGTQVFGLDEPVV